MENIKTASIAFLGRPNVGKSTLFNALQKNVYAIITSKPQTTRNYICSKLELDSTHQLIFIDTPGFHNPINKLDLFLNGEIKFVIKNVDFLCYLIDPTKEFNDEDEQMLKLIKNLEIKNKILIVNKIDLVKKAKIDEYLKAVNNVVEFTDIHQISALHATNLLELIDHLKSMYTTLDEFQENHWQEPSDEFIAKEIVRQSCLKHLEKEVPYGIGIMVNKYAYEKDGNQLLIDADIYVEKESQKSIVIGAGGKMIKTIGTEARQELLKLYDCKVVLKLFVKVKKDWRDDNILVTQMGYKK